MVQQSIKKNFIYQASYEILLIALPILTSPYISRILGAENIGIYSFTYTIAYYFTLFAALGIKNYGNREISRCRDNQQSLNETFTSILYVHFLISGMVLITYMIYCYKSNAEYRLYYIIQSLYLLGTFLDISWLFFGLELFKTTVTRNMIIKVGSVVAIFILIKDSNDLWKYILILAFSNFASQLYLWFKIKNLVHITKVKPQSVFKHLPQLLILFIPTIAVSLYNYMDKVMLGAMAGTTELGFYENAFKITTICSSLIGSVGTVMLPRMSNMVAKGNIQESRKFIRISMQGVIFMSSAMAFGLAGVSEDFAPIFWGSEFQRCGLLLALLAIYLPIQGFASVLRTQFLIPNKWDKQYTISLCVGAFANIIVNYILIPHYLAIGAVIGTIVAETSVCIVQVLFVSKMLPVKTYFIDSIPMITNGVIMYIIVRILQKALDRSIVALGVQIAIGALVYLMLNAIYFKKSNNTLYGQIINFIFKRGK